MGDQDRDPSHQSKNGDQVDKVGEDLTGIGRDVHEGKQTKRGREGKGIDRHTMLVGFLEYRRGGTVRGKTVESTASNVEIGVRSREDEDADATVQDVVKPLNTGELDGGHEGGSRRTGSRQLAS